MQPQQVAEPNTQPTASEGAEVDKKLIQGNAEPKMESKGEDKEELKEVKESNDNKTINLEKPETTPSNDSKPDEDVEMKDVEESRDKGKQKENVKEEKNEENKESKENKKDREEKENDKEGVKEETEMVVEEKAKEKDVPEGTAAKEVSGERPDDGKKSSEKKAEPTVSKPAPKTTKKGAANEALSTPANQAMIAKLHAIANFNKHLSQLMKTVASGKAAAPQIQEFQKYINKARIMAEQNIPVNAMTSAGPNVPSFKAREEKPRDEAKRKDDGKSGKQQSKQVRPLVPSGVQSGGPSSSPGSGSPPAGGPGNPQPPPGWAPGQPGFQGPPPGHPAFQGPPPGHPAFQGPPPPGWHGPPGHGPPPPGWQGPPPGWHGPPPGQFHGPPPPGWAPGHPPPPGWAPPPGYYPFPPPTYMGPMGMGYSPYRRQNKAPRPPKVPKPRVPKEPKRKEAKTPAFLKNLPSKVIVVFEFKDNPVHRYVLPQDSILEMRTESNEILISTLLVLGHAHDYSDILQKQNDIKRSDIEKQREKERKKKEKAEAAAEAKRKAAEAPKAAETPMEGAAVATPDPAEVPGIPSSSAPPADAGSASGASGAPVTPGTPGTPGTPASAPSGAALAIPIQPEKEKKQKRKKKADDGPVTLLPPFKLPRKQYKYSPLTISLSQVPYKASPMIARAVWKRSIVEPRMKQIMAHGLRDEGVPVKYNIPLPVVEDKDEKMGMGDGLEEFHIPDHILAMKKRSWKRVAVGN